MSNQADLRLIEGDTKVDPLVGKTIDGRYEVERVLGEGGMGLVYRCKHIVLGKPLALKVLRPDVSRDEEIMTRFRQEAQSASSIGNQHIIDISDFGTLPDGSTYFVMEYLDGSDLTGVIEKQSPISVARIIHVGKQFCQALGAAHGAGIVHRDLKPDNIYLIKRGGDKDFVKVLDFGIAKVGGSSSKLTRAGQVFGTPHYMSPEQCSGSGVDHRTDIYAIGVILYEMIVGKVPFDADNLMGILTKHLYEEPVPPTQIRPDCPPDLEAIVRRCLAKNQEERYQTMAELEQDLARLEAGVRPDATSRTITSAMGVPGMRKSKAPLLLGLGGLFIVGGIGAAVAAVTLSNEQPPVAPPPVAVAPAPAPEPVVQPVPVPADAPRVRIITTPEAAEVWDGDALLGQTPLEVPRPDSGNRLTLELRKTGFQARRFVISSATLAPELNFSLQVEEEEDRHSGSGRRRPPPTATGPTPPPTQPETTMRRTLIQAEVVDPWANN